MTSPRSSERRKRTGWQNQDVGRWSGSSGSGPMPGMRPQNPTVVESKSSGSTQQQIPTAGELMPPSSPYFQSGEASSSLASDVGALIKRRKHSHIVSPQDRKASSVVSAVYSSHDQNQNQPHQQSQQQELRRQQMLMPPYAERYNMGRYNNPTLVGYSEANYTSVQSQVPRYIWQDPRHVGHPYYPDAEIVTAGYDQQHHQPMTYGQVPIQDPSLQRLRSQGQPEHTTMHRGSLEYKNVPSSVAWGPQWSTTRPPPYQGSNRHEGRQSMLPYEGGQSMLPYEGQLPVQPYESRYTYPQPLEFSDRRLQMPPPRLLYPPQQQQQQQQQQQAYYMFGAGSALIPTAQSMNSAIVASAAANAAAAARGQAGSKAAMNGMRRIMSSPVALDRLGKQANAAARGMLDPNKTSKRKARKAEVARACRKRKKAYIQSLEQKAAVLTKQLSEMSGKARPMKSEEEVHRLEQDQLLSEMEKLLSNRHCNTKDVKKLVSKFAANSRRHQKTYWKHVDSAKKAITPGAQAKFALWSLDQDDEFYTKPGLWKTLINGEISLDDNQVKKLLQLRQEVTESKYELLGLQKKFIDLSNDVNEHLAKRHRLIDMLMETLKPAQAARFFLWVSKNSSCMQMLQTVWKIPEVQNDQESMKS